MEEGRIIGFISIKGGVGKTTTVANLAQTLSEDFNKKVLIVDANFSAPCIPMHYGFLEWKNTLHDVLNNKASIKEAVYQYSESLHILPSGFHGEKNTAFLKLKQHLVTLKHYYDLILIDTTPALNKELLAAMNASDELFIVTTPDHPTLSCTMHAIKLAKIKKIHITGMILNQVLGKKYELNIETLEDHTQTPIVSVLFKDKKIPKSISKTIPLTKLYPKSKTAINFKKLASAIIKENFEDPSFINKIKSRFSKKVERDKINRVIMNHHLSLR
ncbi:MAG TPA: AAA family ATPase [Candidatus Nanoarchaeia archaeon]|nr:AAA family ATPase [Candidatus Nanoarchaeia archaeon]